MTEDLLKYRRRMPHWRLIGSVYFVTWRLAPSHARLNDEERRVIISALRHFAGSRYELYACMVMDDHVHVLVKPLEEFPLQGIVHSWKSFTAHTFIGDHDREVLIWQEEYFDRIVRDKKEFLDKAWYIINNPLKRWPETEKYPWIWIKDDLKTIGPLPPAKARSPDRVFFLAVAPRLPGVLKVVDKKRLTYKI